MICKYLTRNSVLPISTCWFMRTVERGVNPHSFRSDTGILSSKRHFIENLVKLNIWKKDANDIYFFNSNNANFKLGKPVVAVVLTEPFVFLAVYTVNGSKWSFFPTKNVSHKDTEKCTSSCLCVFVVTLVATVWKIQFVSVWSIDAVARRKGTQTGCHHKESYWVLLHFPVFHHCQGYENCHNERLLK